MDATPQEYSEVFGQILVMKLLKKMSALKCGTVLSGRYMPHMYTSTTLQSSIFQKTIISTVMAMRASDLASYL